MTAETLRDRVVGEWPDREVFVVINSAGFQLLVMTGLRFDTTISRSTVADVWADYEEYGRKQVAEAAR